MAQTYRCAGFADGRSCSRSEYRLGPGDRDNGDANLVTNGVYFDAFIPLLPASLTADGVTFNAPTNLETDGTISYVVTSGSDIRYDNNSLFTGGSSDFNAIMNAGGTYETGGAGAGTVTINNLTPGHTYSIQVFDYAGDGDAGLTTLSGSSPGDLDDRRIRRFRGIVRHEELVVLRGWFERSLQFGMAPGSSFTRLSARFLCSMSPAWSLAIQFICTAKNNRRAGCKSTGRKYGLEIRIAGQSVKYRAGRQLE